MPLHNNLYKYIVWHTKLGDLYYNMQQSLTFNSSYHVHNTDDGRL